MRRGRHDSGFKCGRAALGLVALAWLPLATAAGSEAGASLDDGIDRSRPDFIRASLLIADPGTDLCSYLGHAAIRLECPQLQLDYCFSYESERILEHPWRFLAGDLKMGMFAIPIAEYLAANRVERRGVRQYYFNLPPPAKQRLWQLLDERMAEGIKVPYDPLGRSCAVTVLRILAEACQPQPLVIGHWPFEAAATMREIVRDHSVGYDWHRFILCAIFGTEFDKACDPFDKVIIPADLLSVLMDSTLAEQPVLATQPVQLLPSGAPWRPPKVTPMGLALGLLALALVGSWRKWRAVVWGFLGFQALVGFLLTFLVVGSMLPLNPWNWLLVPFNPLPLVCWRWRRWWAWPMVAVLGIWEGFMLFSPHQLTDYAYLVLVLAYGVIFAKMR